jgi:MoaA/NifB/PqqE/SkfB family radical SAM enzyme
VETIVFSGGGEPLLNRELPAIMRIARELELGTALYTTGYNLAGADSELFREVMSLQQLRLSIHSPDPATYAAIAGLPEKVEPLARVQRNVRDALLHRRLDGGRVRIGIGFVIQPDNRHQVEEMAHYAHHLGVDFLNIRKDEVAVTRALSEMETAALRSALRRIRDAAEAGRFGDMVVDFADELTALANGISVEPHRTEECRAKYFRPTISPFGLLAPCDLKAEPRFTATGFNLGWVRGIRLEELIGGLAAKPIPDRCEQCMPSSRTGNSVYSKLLADLKVGVPLDAQPFREGLRA